MLSQPAAVRRPAYLSNLRVLELGDQVSGAAAAAVLASLGATVEKVRVASSSIHAGLPAYAVPGGAESVLAAVLDQGKRFVATPTLDGFAAYDLVICDRSGGAEIVGVPVDLDAYQVWVTDSRAPAWLTISPFGLCGSRREWLGTELITAAASGLMARDPTNGRPIKLGGNQALLGVGQVAALAACHVIDLSRHAGRSVHADVSAQDAAVVTGPVLNLAHAVFRATGDSGARRNGAPVGFYACADGLVRINAMEDHQFNALVRALDAPQWAADFGVGSTRIERADELDALVSSAIAGWSKVECEERLQAAGVPATAMYDAEDLLAWPQFTERGSFDSVQFADRISVMVGPAFRALPTVAFSSTRVRPAGLTDLHVAEAGHVLAVPLATSLLGAMGASVTKLEDPRRMDVYRRRGPYLDGDPGTAVDGSAPSLERSAYFGVMNHSKRSVRIDLENDREALQNVLRSHDVVIENLGFKRARQLGLDAVAVTQEHPHLLGVSSSGYGQGGPWSAYRAYAYNLHAACGLCSQTRTPAGDPAEIDLAWGDLVSAYGLATLIAAWAIAGDAADADECRAIDFSMAELLAARFNENIAAIGAELPHAGPEDGSNHQTPFAPNAVFRTADGGWLALSVGTDAQWRALCLILSLHLAAPVSADEVLRRSLQDVIEAELATAVLAREGAQLATELQSAGVPSAMCASARDLLDEDHLRERGLFPEVDHPVWGRQRVIGLPWRIVGQRGASVRPAPLLGSTSLEDVVQARGPAE